MKAEAKRRIKAGMLVRAKIGVERPGQSTTQPTIKVG